MAPVRALIGLLLCTWTILACDEKNNSENSNYDGPRNECRSDNDCTPEICDPALGICAVRNSTSPPLIARIVPTVQSAIISQYFSVQPSPGTAVSFALRSPVEVFDIGLSFNGTVVFEELLTVVEGLSSSASVYKAVKNEPSRFSLLPGDYRVSLIPDEEEAAAPPHYIPFVRVTEDGFFLDVDGDPVTVDLPDETVAYPVLTGRLRYEVAPDQILAANGLQVVARDPDSGRIVSTYSVSHCTTPASCGEFSLLLQVDVMSVELEISRPEEPFHPVLHFQVNDVDAAMDAAYLMPYPSVPVLFEGKVTVATVSGEPAVPPPVCQILFELDSEDGSRSLSYRARSGGDGHIESSQGMTGVYLYPGDYRITVFPSGGDSSGQNEYAVFESAVPVPPDSADLSNGVWEASLTRRQEMTGQVTAHDEAVANITVSATPLSGEPVSVRAASARTGSKGKFSLPLDFGQYFIVSDAPVQSGFASGITLIDVASDAENISADMSFSIPLVVEGQLVSSEKEDDNADLQGVVVEWYRPYGGKVFLVHRTTVAADGSFLALLPP